MTATATDFIRARAAVGFLPGDRVLVLQDVLDGFVRNLRAHFGGDPMACDAQNPAMRLYTSRIGGGWSGWITADVTLDTRSTRRSTLNETTSRNALGFEAVVRNALGFAVAATGGARRTTPDGPDRTDGAAFAGATLVRLARGPAASSTEDLPAPVEIGPHWDLVGEVFLDSSVSTNCRPAALSSHDGDTPPRDPAQPRDPSRPPTPVPRAATYLALAAAACVALALAVTAASVLSADSRPPRRL